MSRRDRSRREAETALDSPAASANAPGKRALTERLPIQRKGGNGKPAPVSAPQFCAPSTGYQTADDPFALHLLGDAIQAKGDLDGVDVRTHAARGVSGASTALPHAATIQAAFGHHDISGIQAYVGGAASDAASAMGATAYATGASVAFASAPDLHTAAHEAAHVVQQRGGVQLKGGVGEVGDRFEQHADTVADAVVRGESAQALLGSGASGGAALGPAVVQRKGATAGELAQPATDLLELPFEVQALNLALARLESAETDVQNILERVRDGALTHDHAYANVARVMQSMLEPLAIFDNAQKATSPDQPRSRAATRDWFGGDDSIRAQREALDRWRPRVLDSLSNVARAALILGDRERAAGGAMTQPLRRGMGLTAPNAVHDRVAMEAMVGAFASVGASLGWTAPTSLAEADTRRYAYEACPTGAREERPELCNLPDVEREALRRGVARALEAAVEAFVHACGKYKRQLEAMVAKITAGRELILGIVTDAVKAGITAATGGAGGKLIDFAMGVAFTLGEAQLERPGAKDPIRENDTIDMLTSLEAALIAQLGAVGDRIGGLDDGELRRVKGSLEALDDDFFDSKLAPFVAAYRVQVEPIGHPGSVRDRMTARYRAVRVISGDRRRLALVLHDAYNPEHGIRYAPLVHTYRFEGWIDPQFEGAVGKDAIDVAPESVEGIPLMWTGGISP